MTGPDDAFLAPDDALRGFDDDDSDIESGTGDGDRPGGVLVDGDVAGTWRPRKAGGRLGLQVELWRDVPAAVRAGIGAQAERLAAVRGAELGSVDVSG